MSSWKEPVQIERGDQSRDPEDACSSLLYLHLPGHQNPAEGRGGLPRLEVCGPSPGCVDQSAPGERSHFFQGDPLPPPRPLHPALSLPQLSSMRSIHCCPSPDPVFLPQFLCTLSQWCTQTHSLILQNLKPRQRGKKESKEDYLKSTRWDSNESDCSFSGSPAG